MSFDKTTIKFESGGIDCAAWFYRPQGNGPFPGVAMAHGLGVVKEVDIEPFAQSFAAAGIATLLFDYRYWGDSGGEPRCQAIPSAQIEDYRNALTWLSINIDIDEDRLGVWGTSFSGGLVLELGAYDGRVKAVVSQVPALDLYTSGRAAMGAERFAATRKAVAAERKRVYLGNPPTCIALAGVPGGPPAVMTDPNTLAWLENAKRTVAPNLRNEITLASLEHIFAYSPGLSIARIAPTPLLMIMGTNDTMVPPAMTREAFNRAEEPKTLLEIEGDHYLGYSGATQIAAVRAATAFLREHLVL